MQARVARTDSTEHSFSFMDYLFIFMTVCWTLALFLNKGCLYILLGSDVRMASGRGFITLCCSTNVTELREHAKAEGENVVPDTQCKRCGKLDLGKGVWEGVFVVIGKRTYMPTGVEGACLCFLVPSNSQHIQCGR